MTPTFRLADLPGLGESRCKALSKAGVTTPRDLVELLPDTYQDSTRTTPLRDLRAGQTTAFEGEISSIRSIGYGKQTRVHILLEQDGTRFSCVWFGAHWLINKLYDGQWLLLYGRISRSPKGTLTSAHPKFVERRELLPIYADIDGVPPKILRGAIREALNKLDDVSSGVPESIMREARGGISFANRRDVLRQAHFPEEEDKLAAALGYLSFEALALRYAALKRFGNRRQTVPPMDCPDELADTFWAAQKFIPTNAQRRAALDILSDLRSGTAMSRLVEGDVGCGKTAVSFLALYAAAVNGAQGAMMAPTEILAEQHWRNAARMLEPLGVRCGLIKGGMTALNRRDAVRAIASGEWQAVFGTHALFSKDVIFNKLSIAITDEQHRFGVLQRAALAEKSEHTHSLVLSATPIPRTLALLMYGDLKVSIIDELPPGRVPIETRFVPEYKREGLYKFIRKQAELGYQTYIICPHATDSSSEDCACAQWLAEELRGGALNGLRVGLAHGGQASKLRSETLEAFHKGMMDVLVATTVVEVGVDSPRATVMVIENPERYGLAQLHQLRGRVGRGTISSWCFLMGEPNERLTVLARTRDGFEIARKDLEMRGAGDLLGVRQHGLQKTDLAFSSADPETLDRVKSSVDELLDRGGNEADLLISAAKSKLRDVMSIGAN